MDLNNICKLTFESELTPPPPLPVPLFWLNFVMSYFRISPFDRRNQIINTNRLYLHYNLSSHFVSKIFESFYSLIPPPLGGGGGGSPFPAYIKKIVSDLYCKQCYNTVCIYTKPRTSP